MANHIDIERLKETIFDLELPRTEYALYGVGCPYCGKSDRINKLERPEELTNVPAVYQAAWDDVPDEEELVLCTFCRQVLIFCPDDNSITPPA